MSRIAVVLCGFLLFPPMAASAQGQRGSIEGHVTDSLSGLLTGVTVEARSTALVGVASTVTSDGGAYRFPSLPPGRYEVAARQSGFVPAVIADVDLELGQVLKVDLVLKPAGIAITVEVKPESPLVDVKQSTAGGTIASEIIDRVPKGRDVTGLVTSVPGVDNETRNRGLQIDGGSGADNRFFIDGVDHTDLLFGTLSAYNGLGKVLANDFVQQVRVENSGSSAEYRGAIGGVVSAISQSGFNQWRGGVGTYFTSDGLQGAVRPTLQFNPMNQKEAQYVIAPADDFTSLEMVADAWVPVVRDRLWFHGGYNPQETTTRRTVKFRSTGQTATFDSKPVDRIANYSATGHITSGLRTRITGSFDRFHGGAALPNIQTDGTSNSNPALFPTQQTTDSFKDVVSGGTDWVASPRTFVSMTASRLSYGGHDVGTFSDALRRIFVGSNSQFPEIPSDLQNVNGYSDNPSSSHLVTDTFTRYGLTADVTRDMTWRGQHLLKAGLQYERMRNDVLASEQAPTVFLFWDAPYVTLDGRSLRGPYGYYEVTQFLTKGNVSPDNIGLYVQDAWTVTHYLTLNLGLRTENEDVPSYRPENPGIHFGFLDKMAPRLGFAWDPRGDSRWKVFGDWGIYYDLTKLALGRVMFGADQWVDYYYTLDTANWPSISCDGRNCPGTLIATFDHRPVANDPSHNLVDPNLRPTRSEELTAGLEHQVSRTTVLSGRYVHKWVDRAIEAVCDPQYVCGVNNPGFGPARYPFGPDFPVQPVAKRVYDGAEVRLQKRLANRTSLDASYLWSRLWGNWSGINSSDEAVSCLQPNSCTAFDLLYYSYDDAGQPTYGPLATDRPHRFKLQGTYDLPGGTQVGVNYLAESGRPMSTVMRMRTDGINFFPYGRGDLGRSSASSQTDILVQQYIPLPGSRTRLRLGVNVINLFDQMAALGVVTTPYRDAFSISDRQFFAGFDPVAIAAATPGIRSDPRYRLPNNYQVRRSVMLQGRLTF